MRDYASSQHAVPCEPCGGPDAGYVRGQITGTLLCDTNTENNGVIFWAGGVCSYSVAAENNPYSQYASKGSSHYRAKIDIEASQGNYIFGRASTVSVPAYYVLIIIKA